ncbi:MAG: redoxin domain-containing protein [Gammaproteobacteria bacterium]|nr:redoxin domain-containing protein [Gammaproteobacteria bacterium]
MNLIHYSLLISLLLSKAVMAVDMESIPHVSEKASGSFKYDYLYANAHRAFAIAPGGAWSWVADKPTEAAAKKAALTSCQQYTQQKCMLFAVNQQVVFNYTDWYTLWGPYKTKNQARQSASGILLGQKFPDLEFTDPAGKKKSIHKLRGKLSFVHFWGSWCPSCGYEFPAIMDMYRIINDLMPGQVEFVILQVRESFKTSEKWAKENSVERLPLSDSSIKNEDDDTLNINGGQTIKDRQIAKVFPASYVLDKNGIVVFSNMGSIDNWTEYVNFFRHTAQHSGK